MPSLLDAVQDRVCARRVTRASPRRQPGGRRLRWGTELREDRRARSGSPLREGRMAVETERLATEQLAEDFGGQLIHPDDQTFNAARSIYNRMIDRRPSVIARPSGTADVIAAVSFAREHGQPIGVRCGGHSVAGHSLPDGGMLLDLALMKG